MAVEDDVFDGRAFAEGVVGLVFHRDRLAAPLEAVGGEERLRAGVLEARGEGVGARLLRFTAAALADRYDRVLIAVNNPIAYQSCYRAGFAFTGEETGIAELLLAYDPEGGRSAETYRTGLQTFETRDLPEKQRAVVADHSDGEPPPVVDVPA